MHKTGNTDYSAELYETHKIAECVPYEDSDSIDYGDYNWSTDEYEWKEKETA